MIILIAQILFFIIGIVLLLVSTFIKNEDMTVRNYAIKELMFAVSLFFIMLSSDITATFGFYIYVFTIFMFMKFAIDTSHSRLEIIDNVLWLKRHKNSIPITEKDIIAGNFKLSPNPANGTIDIIGIK